MFMKRFVFVLLVIIKLSYGIDFQNDGFCTICKCHGNNINCNDISMTTKNLESMLIASSPKTRLPKNVTSLSFSNNILTSFPVGNFPRMTEVQYLNLSVNLLKRVPDGLSKIFPRLRILDFGSNRISVKTSIFPYTKTVFRNLQFLKELNLKNNYIKMIDKSILGDLTQITSLDLSNNLIQKLYPGFFASFTNHESTIILDYNPLNELTASLFASQRRQTFRKLSFRGCELSAIEKGAFLNVTVRGSVEFDFNKFTALPTSALHELNIGVIGVNTTVSFQENPLHCGCELFELYRSLKTIPGITLLAGQCHSPYQLSGEDIYFGFLDNTVCPLCEQLITARKQKCLSTKNVEPDNCLECQCHPIISQTETRFGICRVTDNTDNNTRIATCKCTDIFAGDAVQGRNGRSRSAVNSDSTTAKSDTHKWVVFGILGLVIVLILVMLTVTPLHPYCRRRVHKRHLLSIRQRLISSSKSRQPNDCDVTMDDIIDVTMTNGDVNIEEGAEVAGCSKWNGDNNDNVFR